VNSDPPLKPPGSPIAAILRGGSLLFSIRVVAQLSRLVYIVLVVRALGPDRYGILAYVQAWGIVFLPLINMGSQTLLSRSFGHSMARGRDIAQRLWTLRMLLMPAVLCLLIAISVAIEPDSEIRPLFLIVGLALAGRGFAVWCNHVLVANRRTRQVLFIEVTFRLGELIAALVVLYLGASVAGLLAVHAVGWWVQALFSSLWVSREIVRPAWHWQQLKAISLLKQSVTVMVCGLSLAGLLQGPLMLGRHLLEKGETLGQFALVMQMLQVLVALPNSIGIVALTFLAGSSARATGKLYINRMVPLSIVAVIILALASALLSYPVLVLVFGAEYGSAAPLLTLGLLVLVLPLAPVTLLSHAVFASTEPDMLRKAALAALAGLAAGILATCTLWLQHPAVESLLVGAGSGAFLWLFLLILIHRRVSRAIP